MKYENWLNKEVLKELLEGYSPAGQVGTPVGGNASASGIYGTDNDAHRHRGPNEEEEEAEEGCDDDLILGKKLYEDEEEKAPVSAEKGGESVAFTIPKLVPTEAWGEPKSSSRKEAYKFFKKFPGRDLATKIKTINGIADKSTNVRSVAKVLSTLVFFDSLSAVVKDFTPSSAGFVFEGFLAALLNGTQEIERSAGGTLDITDLRAVMSKDGKGGLEKGSGYPISLKLLTQGKTDIKGSYANLVGTMAEGNDDQLLYVVVAKDKAEKADILTFHEFDIDPDNFIDIMSQNKNNINLLAFHRDVLNSKVFRKIMKSTGGPSAKELLKRAFGNNEYMGADESRALIANNITPAQLSTQDFFELMRFTRGYYQKHGSGIRMGSAGGDEEGGEEEVKERLSPLMENLKRGPLGALIEGAADAGTQFKVSQSQMRKLNSHRNVGTLDVSPERMKGIMERYAAQLQGTLTDTYENLKQLTTNINEYFLSERTARRNAYAKKAIDSAEAQAEYADDMASNVSGKKTSETE
tara:strand:- start:13237 stop:14805 length:1569 start_codon:yes stop_codon:yes gene_type:complete